MHEVQPTFAAIRSPHGLDDVTVTAQDVVFTPHTRWLDADDALRVGSVVGAIAFAVGGALSPAPLSWLLYGVSAVLLLVVVAIVLLEMAAVAIGLVWLVLQALRLVSPGGRRDLRERVRGLGRRSGPDPGVWRVPRVDVLAVSPPSGRVRPRLELGTPRGVLVLRAWAWRRGSLERLAGALVER